MIGVAIVGVSAYKGDVRASGDEIKSIKVDEASKKSTEPAAIVYDKEIGVWLSEMNAMLSAPLDDPRLKDANKQFSSFARFKFWIKSWHFIK